MRARTVGSNMKSAVCYGLLSVLLWSLCSCFVLCKAVEREALPLPFTAALLSKEIKTLYQDQEGYLWIGTTYGAARYDGYATQLFAAGPRGTVRLTDNEITCFADVPGMVLIGTEKGLNLVDKKTWQVCPSEIKELRHANIKCMITSHDGKVWIATPGRVYRCDQHLRIERSYIWSNVSSSGITSFYEDRQGNIWFLTWGAGIFRLDTRQDVLVGYPPVGRKNRPFVLFQDHSGRYWLGTWGDGLYRFYPDHQDGETFVPQQVGGEVCFDIMQDNRDGNLWMLFYQNLKIFSTDRNGKLHEEKLPEGMDPGRMFSTIFQDRDGQIWMGAYDEGCRVLENDPHLTSERLPFIKRKVGFDANISCMAEDCDGILWLNQERYGLIFYDPVTEQHSLQVDNPQVEVNYIAMEQHTPSAWVASMYVERVFRVKREGLHMVFTDTLELCDGKGALDYVRGVHLDRSGYLWVQTGRTLFVKSPEGRVMRPVRGIEKAITGWTEDEDGRVWLCSKDFDLYKVVHEPQGVRVVLACSFPQYKRNSLTLSHIVADRSGRLWMMAASGEVCCFDPHTRTCSDETEKVTGGRCPVLYCSVRGDTLAVLTPNALVCYNIAKDNLHVYAVGDRQIAVTSFRNSAVCWGKNGALYAGGHEGYMILRSGISSLHRKEDIYFTDITVGGKSLWQDSTRHQDDDGLLCLAADSRQIVFSFSTLDYISQDHIRFVYRMDGEDNWTALARGENKAVYNYLSAGIHKLQVRALNDNGEIIAENTLKFKRWPLWYETVWAKIGFGLLFLGIVALTVYHIILRIKRKNAEQFRQELTKVKLDYFTNVSHELLTPLTVLSCLADEIEVRMPGEQHFTDILRSNTRRLRKLIRQVLDFRKVENRSWPLKVAYADVMAFVRKLSETDFAMLAYGKHLKFECNVQPESAYGYYDADKLEEILFNLLSNAVKYTDSPGRIGLNAKLEQSEGLTWLCLEIWDEGIGIADQEQQRIFTRFYHSDKRQGTESNGIGLALTRELVGLHHGELTLKSHVGKGSCFLVRLPLDKRCYSADERKEPSDMKESSDLLSPEHAGQATVLIVDDNNDLLRAMNVLLGGRYKVLAATDVASARRLLLAERVDLIVCDVRMPETDGLTFCKMLKSDVQISHIPVLMLTAQSDEHTRLVCYEAGADGFMAKPFETGVLKARIENLLLQYKKRQKQFCETSSLDWSVLSKRETDEAFLARLVSSIEKHLQDADLALDLLAEEAGVSKSTLNRKIKTMTGLTPMDFVRNIRLKYACALLSEGQLNISEVAYAVGFSDPQYFARCFKEAFQQTPSQFQQRKRGG